MNSPGSISGVALQLLGIVLTSLVTLRHAQAEKRTWNAKALFEQSVTEHVVPSDDGQFLMLQRGVLYDDDGPAAGYSYKPNVDVLKDGVRFRKQLVVGRPEAKTAVLMIAPGGDVQGQINGRRVQLSNPRKCGNYWQEYAVPADFLKQGTNNIVLQGRGTLWIARADEFAQGSVVRRRHPNRSAKSTDGGKTWDDRQLGRNGNIDGEYYVRLFLDQYHSAGTVTMPVVDLANLNDALLAPPVTGVGPVRISIDAENEPETHLVLRLRTGSTFVPQDAHWSKWQRVDSGDTLRKPRGRFLQLAIVLESRHGLRTPNLKSVTVESQPETSNDWTQNITVTQNRNAGILRTSIPFQYEPFRHPRLKTLRRQYGLDDVVRGAQSEFELITRLAAWSAQQWETGHLGTGYPPWDALEILKPHSDGNPVGGFCQQYNLVFLQACESFGLTGRAVSLGPGNRTDRIRSGHEVVEIWSNEFRKWVYVDGDFGHYVVDAKTRVPLSLLELHNRQLAALQNREHRAVTIVHLLKRDDRWTTLTKRIPFIELRLIPRSNFLQQQFPLPLNQGMRGWFWTGHYVWTDSVAPARRLYGNRIVKRAHWEWTLNTTRIRLEATSRPGTLRVHCDTETPGFKTLEASIDGADAKSVASGFLWTLHNGKNRLQVRSCNTMDRRGPPSHVVLEYR